MREIARGAESIIYLDDDGSIIKKRAPKSYRLKEIDDALRKTRTRREAKVIEKINVPCPKLILADDKDMSIKMEHIDGRKIRDVFDVRWCRRIGEHVASMHNQNIIHGDLTTSNMLLKEDEIYLIDFGLSYFSTKIEDRAVDLHLLKQALESKHYKTAEDAFKEVLEGYRKTAKKAGEILLRLEVVEERGRHKGKGNCNAKKMELAKDKNL